MSKFCRLFNGDIFRKRSIILLKVSCTNISPWEPAPVAYASDDAVVKFPDRQENIFESMVKGVVNEETLVNDDATKAVSTQRVVQLRYLRWPVWLLGPTLLLATGMVPTLWLPLSSVFLGPNVASLLSLTGLDCIFNLGALLFLLLADSCSRGTNSTHSYNSKPPASYQFWNMFANIAGFIIPLLGLIGSQKGFLQPSLPLISFSVLLGPYLLLLSVQILTEALTWHWQSPVWLVTPVVYEAYRVLQLMRGLKLGSELVAPSWMLHTIRGLVCWWVLVLGMQLMRVAWFAGFTARANQPKSSVVVTAD